LIDFLSRPQCLGLPIRQVQNGLQKWHGHAWGAQFLSAGEQVSQGVHLSLGNVQVRLSRHQVFLQHRYDFWVNAGLGHFRGRGRLDDPVKISDTESGGGHLAQRPLAAFFVRLDKIFW
jgi:hypothetical protein